MSGPRARFIGLSFLAAMIGASVLAYRSATPAALIAGYPMVIDGDTIVINSIHIRLAGIDAEEMNEPHGQMAKDAMSAIVFHRYVVCKDSGERSYNRVVASCAIAGVDLGATLVSMGAVLDCAHYSGGRYRRAEPPGIRSRLIQKPYC